MYTAPSELTVSRIESPTSSLLKTHRLALPLKAHECLLLTVVCIVDSLNFRIFFPSRMNELECASEFCCEP